MSIGKTSFTGSLAILILALSACAGTPTSRSTGQSIDDSALAVKAKTALIDNSATKARDINVDVFNGEVQLNGFVATAQEKADAAATVQRVSGVKSVRNNLHVQDAQRSSGEVVDDTVITTKVKSALIADDRTKAYQIKVETKQGNVQLGGFVDSREAKTAATQVAAAVTGVKSVSNDLEVKG